MSNGPDDGLLERVWEKIADLDQRIRIRTSPWFRLYSREEKIVAAMVPAGIVLALVMASNVFHRGEKPFVGNQPVNPNWRVPVEPVHKFDPSKPATHDNVPSRADVAACYGDDPKTSHRMAPKSFGDYLDPDLAISDYNNCDGVKTFYAAATGKMTRQQAADAADHQLKQLGINPDAAGAIVYTLNSPDGLVCPNGHGSARVVLGHAEMICDVPLQHRGGGEDPPFDGSARRGTGLLLVEPRSTAPDQPQPR